MKKDRENLEKTDNLITTYQERDLHRALKLRFCPDETMHEIKMGRFVADAFDGETIFEVQTGSLSLLEKKLRFYLENTPYKIVIVRPIAAKRRLVWLDSESGEVAKAPRLSPKRENIFSGIADIFYIFELFGAERLEICFVEMEIDEVRLLDGYGKQKKIRATSVDRIAGEVFSKTVVKDLDDIRKIVFGALPDGEFSRAELSKCLKLGGLKLWAVQKMLIESGLLQVRKEKNKLIFRKNT